MKTGLKKISLCMCKLFLFPGWSRFFRFMGPFGFRRVNKNVPLYFRDRVYCTMIKRISWLVSQNARLQNTTIKVKSVQVHAPVM